MPALRQPDAGPPSEPYDALLVVSFGGPEHPDDVLPFLENVVRGKNVPRERLLEVAEHYRHCGGGSPINDQNRALIAALELELPRQGVRLPIYWGNRNWNPLLPEAIGQMAAHGVRRALAFVTSAYSSYSGCRQYLENIAEACRSVGPTAPVIDKLRVFYNHPGFVRSWSERIVEATDHLSTTDVQAGPLLFTAHSIPLGLAQTSRYEAELREACRLVADQLGHSVWELVYQSRSGAPNQPWLEPDIEARIAELAQKAKPERVIVAPIGFLSDHMEVIYDLDYQARQLCERFGIGWIRARAISDHPVFVQMVGQLIRERIFPGEPRLALGPLGPGADRCPADCCPAPSRTP